MLSPMKKKDTLNKVQKRSVSWSNDTKSISPRSYATAKRRSVLGESKYGPGSGPQWKAGRSRYPNLYKALLQESSPIRGDNRIIRRIARARIGNPGD